MTDEPTDDTGGPIDVEALTRRYEEERRKRLRTDANEQFVHMEGKYANFAKDPFADPDFTREPVVESVDALVIGAGLGGLLVASRLRDLGVERLRIVDKAGDFGGTWYWNRYPGIRCDVESYIYMPLLEETGYIPTEKYATGREIFEHCQRIGRTYRLYDAALFQTEVTGMVWDGAAKRWRVSTSRGDQIAARFVVSVKGIMSTPKLPGIPGIESFEGHSFHTSRWDYDYTGGDQNGGLVNLADKTVGVIGTGATAIQCVPQLAKWAKQVRVFQRTPSSVDVRNNRPTDLEWARTLEPGWQRKRNENFCLITAGVPQPEDLVDDAWTSIFGNQSPFQGGGAALDPAEIHAMMLEKMERVRRRIDSIIEDKATAEALKPYYHYFCKRPGFSDEYLQAFNRPNVTLVDTAGRGVERITARGLVVAGEEHPVDCLVYATGFDVMTDYVEELGFDPIGRGGAKLSEHWRDGMRTLYGSMTCRFPNFMFTGTTQSSASFNYVHSLLEISTHIAYLIGRCLQRDIAAIEPEPEAVEAWTDLVVQGYAGRKAFLESCTPGYINGEGRRNTAAEVNGTYPGVAVTFFEMLEQWRAEDALRGLRLDIETTTVHHAKEPV